jgi:ubiquinone/menaquinone biosynthesis C-methylase UbiE
MEHHDHVRLLGGVPQPGSVWADFGSGGGAFTLALAECVGSAGAIYSIDKDKGELDRQRQALQKRFPAVSIETMHADFTRPLQLPPLDGIVMANSLHFLARKDAVLRLVRGYLHPHGQLIVVEYNVDRGNIWVPYPFSFPTWQKLAEQNGFLRTRLLATQPSHFLGEMYAAVSQVSP